MIKFVDCSVTKAKPTEYVLIKDKDIKEFAPVQETPGDNCPNVTTPIQSINELGKQLLSAAFEGDIEEARYLLTQGTQFIADWVGTTPLHLAAQNNHVEICEMFLKAGMFCDARNKVDRTPLHMAASEGHYQVAEVLIKHGMDINTTDMLYMTPLHWAAQNGHAAMVELLLCHGAQTDIKNKFNLTPQDIAHQINKLEIVELIQAYEGDSQNLSQDLETSIAPDADGTNDAMEIEGDSNQVTDISHPVIVLDEVGSNGTELNISSINSNLGPMIINLEDSITQNGLIRDPQNQHQSTESTDQVATPVFTTIDSRLEQAESQDNDSSFSAIKLLQEHGISMLPNDSEDSNLLNTVVASGHSVVLTEVGKEMLKSLNVQGETDPIVTKSKAKKFLTLTSEEFLSLTEGCSTLPGTNVKVVTVKPNARRLTVKRCKATPFANNIKVRSIERPTLDVEELIEELATAKKTIEEYKSKLKKKEMEVERYKFQLKLLLDST